MTLSPYIGTKRINKQIGKMIKVPMVLIAKTNDILAGDYFDAYIFHIGSWIPVIDKLGMKMTHDNYIRD